MAEQRRDQAGRAAREDDFLEDGEHVQGVATGTAVLLGDGRAEQTGVGGLAVELPRDRALTFQVSRCGTISLRVKSAASRRSAFRSSVSQRWISVVVTVIRPSRRVLASA